MDKTYEIGRGGGLTTVRVKDHAYDVVEFTIKKYLEDENGKIITKQRSIPELGTNIFEVNKKVIKYI